MDLLTIKTASGTERKHPTNPNKKSNNNLDEFINLTNQMKKSFEFSLKKIIDAQEDLNQKVDVLLDNCEELKNNRSQTRNDGMGKFVVDPKSGLTCVDENGVRSIHIGKGIWMKEAEYSKIVWNSSSTSEFVKNMGVKLFGERINNSSATRMTASRIGEKKEPLDATKCIAIREMVDYYLRNYRKWTNEVKIRREMNNVSYYLGVKIGATKKESNSCKERKKLKYLRTKMAGRTKKAIKGRMKEDDLGGLKLMACTSEFQWSTEKNAGPSSSGNDGDDDSTMDK